MWPAVRSLGEGEQPSPVQRPTASTSASTSSLVQLPPSGTTPTVPLPNQYRRESYNTSSNGINPSFLAQQQAPVPTELSAVDGLMNLFGGSDNAPNSHAYPMTFGSDTPAIESKPPVVPISHPVAQVQASNTLNGFGTDNIFNSDIFSFDDVSAHPLSGSS